MATKRLGEILLEKKLITPQALEHALLEQKKSGELLGRALIKLGYISERQLLEGLAEHLQIPIINLKQAAIDQEALRRVPVRFAWHYRCMPLRVAGKVVTVAMSDPLNVFATDDVRLQTGCEIKVVIASEQEIKEALQKYY